MSTAELVIDWKTMCKDRDQQIEELKARLTSAELSLKNHAPHVYKLHIRWCKKEGL